jgi:histidine triad (HIT) family protein
MTECIFCKIIGGEIPSKKVYENEKVLAFLDINPKTQGHTIVVPKKHYINILDVPDSEIKPLFISVKKVAGILKEKLSADGFNIIQNNFSAAGQDVMHCHIHIIPRKENDNVIQLHPKPTKPTSEELDIVLKKLK